MSRVLSGRADISISPKTREAVLKAAEDLGYRPNTAARALIKGRTDIVALWMSLQYSRYRAQVLDRLRSCLQGTDLALAITDVDEEYQADQSFARPLRLPCDGIIAFDNSASVEAFARQYERIAPLTPYLSMGAYWSEKRSYVGVDIRAGADNILSHLISQGRKSIAYVVPFNSDLVNRGPRYDAYTHAMTNLGMLPDVITVKSTHVAHVSAALADRIAQGTLPHALYCMNDDIALSAVAALTQKGVIVGKDVAITGYDGIEEGEYCSVPITTVAQPIDTMCELAVSLLKVQLEEPNTPLQQHILTPQLVIRDSTGT